MRVTLRRRSAFRITISTVFASITLCVMLVCSRAETGTPISPTPTAAWQVYFSPNGGCSEAIVATINSAQQSVYVQAYSFTSAPIAKALVDAHNRGVTVEIVLDKSQRTERYSSADYLVHAGIPTSIDAVHAIAHNKVIIIDGRQVITGSFNFTKAAEKNNAENLLILSDPALAERYLENWKLHQAHSEVYHSK